MKGMGIAQKFRDLQKEKVTTSRAQKLKLGISKDCNKNHSESFLSDEMTQDKDQVKCVNFPPTIQTSSR